MHFTSNKPGLQRNADIDALLRQMAKADGYDARKLPLIGRLLHSRFDTSPCESEVQEADPTPVPLVRGSVAGAVIVCLCIFAGVALAVIAWAVN